jgi:Beta-propeller repeat
MTLGNGIALDRAGAAYVTGTTNTTSFPITRDALPTAHLGGAGHAFVVELAPLGQRLLYATYVGGRGAEKGRSVAVDDRGAAYITGEIDSRDFPTTRGAFQTVPRARATERLRHHLGAQAQAVIALRVPGRSSTRRPAGTGAVNARGAGTMGGAPGRGNEPRPGTPPTASLWS